MTAAVLVLSLLFFAPFCPPSAQSQKGQPVKSIEDSVFDGLVKPDEPGFAVLIRVGGRDG